MAVCTDRAYAKVRIKTTVESHVTS